MSDKKFVIDKSWLFKIKRDFARRWKIDIKDGCFYERCITMISKIIGEGKDLEVLTEKAHLIAGKIYCEKYVKLGFSDIINKFNNNTTTFCFSNSELYHTLNSLSSDTNFLKFIELMEYIINFYKKDKDDAIIVEFNDIASLSNKNIRLCYSKKYKFYPSGVEIFDERLVNDVLEFLKDYPTSHKELTEALQCFLKKSYRDAVDKTRLALEMFLKDFLKNNKSLEKQIKEEICKFLGENIHQNTKSMFLQVLDHYAKLNNNNAKHNSGCFNEYEVEFLFYLVGIFIRLLKAIKPKKP